MYSWGEMVLAMVIGCISTAGIVMKLTVWLAGPLGCR